MVDAVALVVGLVQEKEGGGGGDEELQPERTR